MMTPSSAAASSAKRQQLQEQHIQYAHAIAAGNNQITTPTGTTSSATTHNSAARMASEDPTTHLSSSSSSRKEIYTYEAPWTIFAMAWSRRIDPTSQFRLAIGSYVEQYSNNVVIMKKLPTNQNTTVLQQQQQQNCWLYKAGEFDHPYPCTKIAWSPDPGRSIHTRDLLATTGDYLRLWNVVEDTNRNNDHVIAMDSVDPNSNNNASLAYDDRNNNNMEDMSFVKCVKECLLNNNKTSEYCAPLTSFDWNEADTNIIGTSSIDTTCTIWDIETQTARTQLIAHDREVFDLAFARGKDVFASVGADGSVRMFDLRSLEHSTIIYESPNLDPLLRLEWNKQDPNYLATFMADSRHTIILDIRVPSIPVAELGGHLRCVSAAAWAPHSSCHICTAGEDNQALIWDLSTMGKRPIEDPILAYQADGEVNNLQWSDSQPDWVSIAFNNKLQILRV